MSRSKPESGHGLLRSSALVGSMTMLSRILGLLRDSALVGSMTMLSRILGLLRDVVIAAFVGASANADAFFVAFKIPNFLRRLFAEGAFSQAFVPVLADYKEEG
jgi:putative peptidoglycan lipid II flippase